MFLFTLFIVEKSTFVLENKFLKKFTFVLKNCQLNIYPS